VAGDRAAGGREALTSAAPFFVVDYLAFRPIVDDDVPRLAAWLTDPAVGAWWEGTTVAYDDAYVRAEMLHGDDEQHVTQAIVELGGRPIGFQQWYSLDGEPEAMAKYGLTAADRAYGIDQLIGESSLHGRGIGTRQVRAVVGWLLGPDGPGARRVVTDPVVENTRAVRCYEKAGFRVVRRLPGHETIDGEPRDSWLMEWASVGRIEGQASTESGR
jgi:aminoglycoside 6'-N-acetyltransferase